MGCSHLRCLIWMAHSLRSPLIQILLPRDASDSKLCCSAGKTLQVESKLAVMQLQMYLAETMSEFLSCSSLSMVGGPIGCVLVAGILRCSCRCLWRKQYRNLCGVHVLVWFFILFLKVVRNIDLCISYLSESLLDLL
jgi:hypothetical protein